ncbi:YihY/virulence factor BrkB family protein [Nocardia sp. NPDC058058]|uniref:YihY/virulence factor BrkB family protein n=1 Tax=Nocardia sp. NPDC058058 TaxID=3346317 RepID=UPI0036D7FFBF
MKPDSNVNDPRGGVGMSLKSPWARRYSIMRLQSIRVGIHTIRAAWSDELSDRAATLTYHSMLSLFPALLIAMAVLGLLEPRSADSIAEAARRLGPGDSRVALVESIQHLQPSANWSGPVAIIGFVSAIWTVSSYLGAFIRAANSLYGVSENRSAARMVGLRLLLSVLLVISIVGIVVGLALTAGVATRVGGSLHITTTVLTVWRILRWPVLALIASVALALLYWVAPNIAGQRIRWLTPGSLLAVATWIAGSACLAFYADRFDSFNRLYGSLAAAVIVLVWMWLSNFALLLGAVIDSQISRQRLLAGTSTGEAHDSPVTEMIVAPDHDRSSGRSGLRGVVVGNGVGAVEGWQHAFHKDQG